MAIPICLCMTNVGKGLGCPAHGGAYALPKTERVLAAWVRVNIGSSVDDRIWLAEHEIEQDEHMYEGHDKAPAT